MQLHLAVNWKDSCFSFLLYWHLPDPPPSFFLYVGVIIQLFAVI